MKRAFLALIILLVFVRQGHAQSRMHFYFNKPVDTSVSTGVNAISTGSSMADTIIEYINKAQSTLDIEQYEYVQGSYSNIATAVNNAYARGVIVRWIYDSSISNSGVAMRNVNIHALARVSTNGIMHNKVVIIDANASDPAKAYVLTGSADWNTSMFSTDYNNLVAIQDQQLAIAYTAEFNMMWGSTGAVPNLANSKFGSSKTDLGAHSFTIDGHIVELYFSPSDNTSNHIQTAISSANTDLYFGMYTFTDNTDATMIVSRKNAGVYVAGIDDQFSDQYSPYTTFTNGLGSNFRSYHGAGIYHNKYMIVDPSDKCSDPQVLTGSHNWTSSANSVNDENTLIIHSDTVANLYYQSFYADFMGIGGTIVAQHGCSNEVAITQINNDNVAVYPNPSTGSFNFSYNLPVSGVTSLTVTDATGRIVAIADKHVVDNAGTHSVSIDVPSPGLYFWVFSFRGYTTTGKLVKL